MRDSFSDKFLKVGKLLRIVGSIGDEENRHAIRINAHFSIIMWLHRPVGKVGASPLHPSQNHSILQALIQLACELLPN